jgi:transcriptional regulator with XRE-family HTH domain
MRVIGNNCGNSVAPVVIGARIQERLRKLNISQAELGRRVGLTQPAIANLIHRNKTGTSHLHRIARELGTTPAYLAGETDDPDHNAPDTPPLSADEHRLVTIYRRLPTKDQAALKLLIARMAGEA